MSTSRQTDDVNSVRYDCAYCFCSDLILRLTTCQEISAGNRDIIDLNLSYNQVIFGFCWHRRFTNTHSLREEPRDEMCQKKKSGHCHLIETTVIFSTEMSEESLWRQ